MNMKEYSEFRKRYDKFKKNNLPTPFYDKERDTFEYVYYDENIEIDKKDLYDRRITVCSNLTDALSNLTCNDFYYSYSCRYKIENGKKVSKHAHSHSFEVVVRDLYDYPESFNISKDEEEFYSKQELNYLRRVQKYLLFIGMKDYDDNKRSVSRYRNKLQKKYGDAIIHKYSNSRIEDFISGKSNFRVIDYYESFDNVYNEDTFKGFNALFIDDNDDIRLYVRYTSKKIVKYHEIKDVFSSDFFKDDDNVLLIYFEIIEKF